MKHTQIDDCVCGGKSSRNNIALGNEQQQRIDHVRLTSGGVAIRRKFHARGCRGRRARRAFIGESFISDECFISDE